MSVHIIHDAIEKALQSGLHPTYLEVVDESHEHSRRSEVNPETHFSVVIVSGMFTGLTQVRRQQLVYSFLSGLFKTGLHALRQATYTPEEWAKSPIVSAAPACSGKKPI